MMQKFVTSLAIMLLPLSAATAKETGDNRAIGVEASISFPSYGTIRNFEADGDDGVWIEDQHRNWYYATIIGPCTDLDFVQKIGIDTRGTARLDKFGAIIVAGQRCAFSSFVTSDKPLPRKERRRLEKAEPAADAAEKDVAQN